MENFLIFLKKKNKKDDSWRRDKSKSLCYCCCLDVPTAVPWKREGKIKGHPASQ